MWIVTSIILDSFIFLNCFSTLRSTVWSDGSIVRSIISTGELLSISIKIQNTRSEHFNYKTRALKIKILRNRKSLRILKNTKKIISTLFVLCKLNNVIKVLRGAFSELYQMFHTFQGQLN